MIPHVDLWIPGRPKPAERPRLGRRRRAYTPQATLDAENVIATEYQRCYGTDHTTSMPLLAVVDYSQDGERIQLFELDEGARSPMRGDIDNYNKTTFDGLQKGNAFLNDRQIVGVWSQKHPNGYDLEHMTMG